MNEQYRPSKHFLIRGAVATGIVALILIVQTDWFRALFHKPPIEKIAPDATVGDFVGKDSNNNSIPDWEEKLWGLDPTVLYTGGVTNEAIIAQKKQALSISNNTGEPENETDALARQLLTITAALGESGQLSNESLAQVGARLAEEVEFQQYVNHYSLKDIRAVQTTPASLNAYFDAFSKVADAHASDASEIDIIVSALENGDTRNIGTLTEVKASYERFAKELIALSVPIGIQAEHLELTNSIWGLSVAVGYMSELESNGANALAGVALYKVNDARLSLASDKIRTYLQRYGILEP